MDAHFNVPDPDFSALLGTADDHVAVIGTPCDVSHAARVVLVGFVECELVSDRVHVPDDHASVLGSTGKVLAIVGELAEPDFVAVVIHDLKGHAGEVVPIERAEEITVKEDAFFTLN